MRARAHKRRPAPSCLFFGLGSQERRGAPQEGCFPTFPPSPVATTARMFVFLCQREALLCTDVLRLVDEYTRNTYCQRCGVVVGSASSGVWRACLRHQECLCFVCHHKACWPRA